MAPSPKLRLASLLLLPFLIPSKASAAPWLAALHSTAWSLTSPSVEPMATGPGSSLKPMPLELAGKKKPSKHKHHPIG